jgi:aminoglycoside phosphotransferase (APT) family kinase protein
MAVHALADVLDRLRRYDARLVLDRVLADSAARAVVVMRGSPGQVLVAKVDEDPQRLVVEADVLTTCQGTVPVPEVHWLSHDVPGILLMEHVDGVPLATVGAPAAWEAAGDALRRIHGVVPPAALRSLGPDGSLRSWVDRQRAAARSFSMFDTTSLVAALGEAGAAPPGGGAPDALLHGDAAAVHYLIDEVASTVAGVLDFGNALVGDPALDIVSLTLRAPARLEDVLRGYQAPPALRARLASDASFYRLVVLVSRLAFLVARAMGTERAVQLIERELASR